MIIALVPVEVTLTSNTSYAQIENTTSLLTCNTHNGNPESAAIVWYINGTEQIDNNADESITLVASRSMNGQEIWCEAHQLEEREPVQSSKEELNITCK